MPNAHSQHPHPPSSRCARDCIWYMCRVRQPQNLLLGGPALGLRWPEDLANLSCCGVLQALQKKQISQLRASRCLPRVHQCVDVRASAQQIGMLMAVAEEAAKPGSVDAPIGKCFCHSSALLFGTMRIEPALNLQHVCRCHHWGVSIASSSSLVA